MRLAALQSPSVAGAIESLRAARSAAAGRKSAFQPKVEAHVRGAAGHNLDGVLYEKHDATRRDRRSPGTSSTAAPTPPASASTPAC